MELKPVNYSLLNEDNINILSKVLDIDAETSKLYLSNISLAFKMKGSYLSIKIILSILFTIAVMFLVITYNFWTPMIILIYNLTIIIRHVINQKHILEENKNVVNYCLKKLNKVQRKFNFRLIGNKIIGEELEKLQVSNKNVQSQLESLNNDSSIIQTPELDMMETEVGINEIIDKDRFIFIYNQSYFSQLSRIDDSSPDYCLLNGIEYEILLHYDETFDEYCTAMTLYTIVFYIGGIYSGVTEYLTIYLNVSSFKLPIQIVFYGFNCLIAAFLFLYSLSNIKVQEDKYNYECEKISKNFIKKSGYYLNHDGTKYLFKLFSPEDYNSFKYDYNSNKSGSESKDTNFKTIYFDSINTVKSILEGQFN